MPTLFIPGDRIDFIDTPLDDVLDDLETHVSGVYVLREDNGAYWFGNIICDGFTKYSTPECVARDLQPDLTALIAEHDLGNRVVVDLPASPWIQDAAPDHTIPGATPYVSVFDELGL